MNLARLNHIFIPTSKEGRDRLRSGFLGKLGRPLAWLYWSLTEEGRFLLLFCGLIGVVGLDISNRQVYVVWSLLFALLLASFAIRGFFGLKGVQATVHHAPRVAVGEELQLRIVLKNSSDRTHQGIRVERPVLPWDGSWTSPLTAAAELPAGESVTVSTSARFVERGPHHLDIFGACSLVPVGLVQGRRVGSDGARFLVVPQMANVTGLQLPTGKRYQPGGVALASRTGESMELCGVRPYRGGDRIRDLHSRSWARTGEPMVREYQQEYFTRVGVVLDTDGTVCTEPQLEAAITLCAGIVRHLTQGEALIDLLVTGREIHSLSVGRSLGSLEQALDHLAHVQGGGPLDSGELLPRLAPYFERLSSVVVVCLTWDAERRELVESIRSKGVGCRGIVVAPKEVSGAFTVRQELIEGGESLQL